MLYQSIIIFQISFGALVYAGLQGFVSVLKKIGMENNLGHPLCDHLRQGFWALDYIVSRLERYRERFPELMPIKSWINERFELLKKLPNFLLPKYFNIIVMTLHYAAQNRW